MENMKCSCSLKEVLITRPKRYAEKGYIRLTSLALCQLKRNGTCLPQAKQTPSTGPLYSMTNCMEYKLKRVCKDCKNVDSYDLSKLEAAFKLYDSSFYWNTECNVCGSPNCESLILNHPKLDKQLLDVWGNDPELFLMEQDEELFLAEDEYFDMLIEAIDNSEYPKEKLNVLIEAICVLLYDNTIAPHEYSKKENKDRKLIADKVRPELIKRKERIREAGDAVMDYIKVVVYPQIGLMN
ncbi:MAG: hypothetical protein NXI10_16480 [bacterium]|nr:hypothetical protein [bacterium]